MATQIIAGKGGSKRRWSEKAGDKESYVLNPAEKAGRRYETSFAKSRVIKGLYDFVWPP